MITSAEFYAQMQIFGIQEHSGPPTPPSPGGIFTPVVTASTNLTSVTPLSGMYSGNKSTTGGIITVYPQFTVVATDAGSVCSITMNTPIITSFVNLKAATLCGLASITLDTGTPMIGNTGSGWDVSLLANVGTSTITYWFEVSQSAVEYILNLGFVYEV